MNVKIIKNARPLPRNENIDLQLHPVWHEPQVCGFNYTEYTEGTANRGAVCTRRRSASEVVWSGPNQGQIACVAVSKDAHTALVECLPDRQLLTEQDS